MIDFYKSVDFGILDQYKSMYKGKYVTIYSNNDDNNDKYEIIDVLSDSTFKSFYLLIVINGNVKKIKISERILKYGIDRFDKLKRFKIVNNKDQIFVDFSKQFLDNLDFF